MLTGLTKTALFAAVQSWNAKTTAAILGAAPALIAATDPRHRQAIHLACAVKPDAPGLMEADGTLTVSALLEAGADLEAVVPMDEPGDFRATPLWYAVARGENHPLVDLLLARGADASFCLWAVVWRDDADLCRALLATRPRLDLIAEGETPIFYAARLRRLKTLDLLIDAGADPTILDPRGRDAATIARERGLPAELISRLSRGR